MGFHFHQVGSFVCQLFLPRAHSLLQRVRTVRIGSVLFQVIPTYLHVPPPPPAPSPGKKSPTPPKKQPPPLPAPAPSQVDPVVPFCPSAMNQRLQCGSALPLLRQALWPPLSNLQSKQRKHQIWFLFRQVGIRGIFFFQVGTVGSLFRRWRIFFAKWGSLFRHIGDILG